MGAQYNYRYGTIVIMMVIIIMTANDNDDDDGPNQNHNDDGRKMRMDERADAADQSAASLRPGRSSKSLHHSQHHSQ